MTSHIYRIFIITILILWTHVLRAQGPNTDNVSPSRLTFMRYTAEQGLSNSHVNAIGQDSRGLIWVGTNDGLNRFDGIRFQTFHYSLTDSTSISSNTIYAIFTDRDNTIWFGTFTGLCSYDYKAEQFVRHKLPPQPNTLAFTPVRAIAQTPDGHLWLATSGGGLARMDIETHDVKYYRHSGSDPESVCSDYLQAIAVDDSGRVWVGSENSGISILDPATGKCRNITRESGQIGSNVISTMYKASNGQIWIGAFEGNASVYNPASGRLQTIRLSDNNLSVFGITEGKSGDIWIGTQEEGLFHHSADRIDHFCNAAGNVNNLINDNIHALFTDDNSNLWLGMFQGGINMMKPRPIFDGFVSGTDTRLTQKTILGIYPDGKENIYICTDGDGLLIWNSASNEVEHITAGIRGLKSNSIRCAYKDHENRVWLGTYLKGLQEYDTEKKVFRGYENIPGDDQSLSNNDVTAIVEDRLGNLWIGTNGGGLNRLDKQTGRFIHYRHSEDDPKKSIINNHITSLYLDSHGYLWITTYWGLSQMDPVNGDVRNYELIGYNNTYICLYEDSKQRFWAGTTMGLKLMNTSDGSFQVFSTQEGLPSNVVNGIVEDREGNLWLSTNQGICKFNYDKGTIRNFYTEDGLMSNEFIHNSVASDNDGEIYFGSVGGITRFYPEKINSNRNTPRVAITDLLIFNQRVSPNDSHGILSQSISETNAIELNWNDNSFTLTFNAIDYIQPQKIKYAFRITGFDSQWTYHNYSQNTASYTNLDAGVYHFELKATSDGETWSKPISLRITIVNPIWKRWWAIMLYIIAIAAIIYWWWMYVKRTEREKQEIKIENMRQQNDIELNKSRLQFFTNISHEFRTPLTLIMSPLEEIMENPDMDAAQMRRLNIMHRNAERLLRLVNQIMDLRKIDNNKEQLNPVRCNLVQFVREIAENFQQLAESNGIAFAFGSTMQEYWTYIDTEKIDKAIYNLLSNAFKFTPEGGRISVNIRRADNGQSNNVVIIVEDNGKGIAEQNIDKIFDRFFQGDTSTMQQGTGIGLWLTKQFIEMHNGIISVSSQVGRGTAFTIMLTDGQEFSNMAASEPGYSHIGLHDVVEQRNNDLRSNAEASGADTQASRPSILVVEDNTDIREYLSQGLMPLYNISTASNGDEGLQSARKNIPDLVITDITMPVMDGIEMSRKLKSDIETCHIPIIMLTAKTSEEQRIEGLESGADSYIPKPFNPKHLLVRIEKLLELRRTLKDKFGNEIGFDAEQTAIAVPDRDLLKKVTSVIKKRLSDSSLSVETLAEEVGISRGHLQRKLKNLTGQNPNEFIRIIRLKQAAEILGGKDVSIAEVSEMVGFNSQSYFSTAFTKQFNISPSQYVERNRDGA